MSNANKNKAAEAAALLTEKESLLKEKQEFLSNLPETATDEEKLAAKKEVDDLLEEIASFKKPGANEPKGKIKIRFIASPTGKFKLAYNKGEEADFEIKQAAELIEAGFAEKVKK